MDVKKTAEMVNVCCVPPHHEDKQHYFSTLIINYWYKTSVNYFWQTVFNIDDFHNQELSQGLV